MHARLVLLLVAFAGSAFALEIHVSPDGTVNSLSAARDAARKARAAGEKDAIVVRIADGVYPISEPVVFEPQDSAVSYEAAPGARPLFTGGRKIAGFKAGADGVWTAKVDPSWKFEALWVNGGRATRARTPNADADGHPVEYLQAQGPAEKPLPGIPLDAPLNQTALKVAPADAARLAGLSPEELREAQAVVYHSWEISRHRVAGVDAAAGVLQFTGPSAAPFFHYEPFHRLHLENYRAALDAPGEWFLARDGTLSYIPRAGEKPESAEVWAPVAPQWLLLRGDPAKDARVERLRFSGLRFHFQGYALPPGGVSFPQAEVGLGAAIEADGASDVVFEGCEFAHTLTHAAWLRRGCHGITFLKCRMHDLGAGGVKIGDPAVRDGGVQHTDRVTLDDCIVHGGGRYFMGGIGVTIFHASDCTLRHCDIADFFYTGVSIGWTWGYGATACARNVVEHCRIHHLGWSVLSDMGAIYTLGPQPGTVIRGCHFHDIGCASYGAWGMYNDEGSTGIVWENNLVHHTQSAGYHQHYGRGNTVRNNIIAYCAEEHVRRSKPEEFFAFAFERNIVLLGEGKLFAHVDKNWDDGRVWLADNVYWKPDGPVKNFAGKSWADWQFMGRDSTSAVADPLFVAPEKGDWTLRPESPALRLGFVPFDWKLAGVTGDDAWRRLGAQAFPPMKYGIKPKPPALTLRDGFENTPLGGKPANAAQHVKNPAILSVVADRPAKGVRCLQLTDGPEVEPAFDPHFYYSPGHERGVTRVAFDVRAEPAFSLLHEWRDSAEPYRTGPMLFIEKGGIRTADRKLCDLPGDTWAHIEVSAKLGPDSDATWVCTVTLPGREPQRFEGLKFVKPDMKELTWLGFIGAGKQSAKCWLDEMEIANGPAK